MLQQCRHIFTGGRRCRQVALNDRPFCYYHQNRQPRRRRSLTRAAAPTQTLDYGAIPVSHPEPRPIVDIVFPEDRAAIQLNLYNILQAQASNRIDTRTANSMTWNQQVCMANLARNPLIETEPARPAQTRSGNTDSSDFTDPDTGITYTDSGSSSSRSVSRPITHVILTPDGDEIAPPVEILEDNEAEPIHHKGCPCLLCAEKYRNQPPEEHHADCQCGLCEDQEPTEEHLALADLISEDPDQQAEINDDVILNEVEGPASESLAQNNSDHCRSKRRIARASALLSGSTSRDPLNRPWSIADYTFGDAIRRHEAQYAARAAAALAVGIEPPPYEPYITGLIRPGTPEWEEEQQMQQHSSEYWADHFRRQIAERPDIQQYLAEVEEEEEQQQTAESAATTEEPRAINP
jgi:hypothetical protein